MKTTIPLEQLEALTVAFLDLAETLGRPLLARERRCFAWIIGGWRIAILQDQMRTMDKRKSQYYFGLVEKLNQLIHPDPVRQVRLKREKPDGAVAELNEGNYSVKSLLFSGCWPRRMTLPEAMERTALLAKLADGIVVIARELALLRNRNYPDAARIVKAAEKLAGVSRVFVKRVQEDPSIPAEPSSDEIMDQAQTMHELMAEPPDEDEPE